MMVYKRVVMKRSKIDGCCGYYSPTFFVLEEWWLRGWSLEGYNGGTNEETKRRRRREERIKRLAGELPREWYMYVCEIV